MKDKEKKRNSKAILKRILRYIFKYKLSVVGILIFSVAEAILNVISPKLAGKGITALSAIDDLGRSNIDMDYIFKLLATLLILYSLTGIFSCLSRYLFTDVSIKIMYNLRQEISIKMNKVSFKYIREKSQGDILSCIINDVETLSLCFIESINNLISSTIVAFGTLYMMFFISFKMTLTSLSILPIMLIIAMIIINRSQRHFNSYRENLGRLNSCIEESFLGFETVKAFNGENKILNEFSIINKDLYKDSFKCEFFSGILSPIMEFLSKVIYVLCCIIGGYLAVSYKLAIGDITAFIVYSQQFIKPLIDVSGIFGGFQRAIAAAKRIFEFLDAPEEKTGTLKVPSDIESIEFKNISFKYGENNTQIKNISFKIKRGQTIAIVGKTGCGKTTLFKLLMRFYEPNFGEILLNSQNIKEFNLKEYRKLFGIVTQDSWVYNASILENIRYGNLKVSDEEIKQTCKIIGIEEFINSLPAKYETIIKDDNLNISQGQKQLICIARALISNCKILILDEATASVDTFTESRLERYLNSKDYGDKINIIIAHRLSTIRNADKIFVIKEGILIESGTHAELIKEKRHYFTLYKYS